MKKQITLAFLCISISLNAQISEVKDEVENAFEYYQDAFQKIRNARVYIDEAFSANSITNIQYAAGNVESELSSAIRYVSYAEDDANDAEYEASSLNCKDAEDSAGDAEDYFYTAKRKLNDAMSELSNARYEDDTDYLANYLNNANSYISNAITQLNYAVEELNNTLTDINNCGVPTSDSYYTSSTNNTPSCDDLLNYIEENGYSKGTIRNYTLDSEWLYEVKAYTYEYKVYVIAKIKKNEYSYQTNTYIFCGIPSRNWSNFKNGAYGDSDSYSKRFHKYIIDYKCDCY